MVYGDIIKRYVEDFDLVKLHEWLCKNKTFGIDTKKIRVFLKEVFEILDQVDAESVSLFGQYLEAKNRLKIKENNNSIKVVNWDSYLNELNSTSGSYNVVSEIILFVYSYCGGSHFGNDHGFIEDIKKIRSINNIFQITAHNEDFAFKIKEENIEFHQVNLQKKNLNLSKKIYKTIETLPELYIVLGKDCCKKILREFVNITYPHYF